MAVLPLVEAGLATEEQQEVEVEVEVEEEDEEEEEKEMSAMVVMAVKPRQATLLPGLFHRPGGACSPRPSWRSRRPSTSSAGGGHISPGLGWMMTLR